MVRMLPATISRTTICCVYITICLLYVVLLYLVCFVFYTTIFRTTVYCTRHTFAPLYLVPLYVVFIYITTTICSIPILRYFYPHLYPRENNKKPGFSGFFITGYVITLPPITLLLVENSTICCVFN